MKRLEEITFDDDLLIEYKQEIEEINNMCEELDNDKSFQRMYKKYLKAKKKRNFNYNKLNNSVSCKKEISNNILKTSVSKKENYVTDVQLEERFG